MDISILKKDCDRIIVKKLKDVGGTYKKPIYSNKKIYSVYIKDFGVFESGITIIEPGNVNGEFYMTKGHKHEKPRREIYIPIKGKGKLLIQNKGSKVYSLKIGKVYEIPARSAHRLINTGKTKLEVLTIYAKDAGHDYNVNFKKRFFRKQK